MKFWLLVHYLKHDSVNGLYFTEQRLVQVEVKNFEYLSRLISAIGRGGGENLGEDKELDKHVDSIVGLVKKNSLGMRYAVQQIIQVVG